MLSSGVQSILLLGDKGVGKKTLVRSVIADLDLTYVEYDHGFGINDARALKDQITRKSAFNRIYLIDGDETTVQAYNALLKTLEEPPENVTIVICSSKPPISTIISRCRVIHVPQFTVDELKDVLQFNGMSQRAAQSVVPYAHGSYTRALRVYEVQEEKNRLVAYLQVIYKRDVVQVMKLASSITEYDINLLKELCEDLIMSRYGLSDRDMSALFKCSPIFLSGIKDALEKGRNPGLNWLRAYFSTI